MVHILYNNKADNNHGEINARGILENYKTEEVLFTNITELSDVNEYLTKLTGEDKLVLAGGDGTLNNFINAIDGHGYNFPIYCYAAGSGNDFMHDVGDRVPASGVIQINEYLRNLPTVTVYGEDGSVLARDRKFINGVGYGIDGYCCEVGDAQKKVSEKPVNYAAIAIKGLLFHYKPANAKVTVDGKTQSFRKVWLAPTMHGRYYGGGMMVAPEQNRSAGDGEISVVVMHGSGKIKTLMVFPSIFKGEHVRHTEMVTVCKGREITVEFDRPTALQIDGETYLRVSRYTARGVAAAVEPETADSEAQAEERREAVAAL